MKIQVLHNYGGKPTKEQRILPGVYDADDPALFGLARYLVENGHARSDVPFEKIMEVSFDELIEKGEISGDGWSMTVDKSVVDYESLSLEELRLLLEAHGMTEELVVSDMSAHWTKKRTEIITWLELASL